MAASTPREEPMAAIFAALNPYTWRSFSAELLARRVIAAMDRRDLSELLSTVPGAAVGSWDDVPEPAAPNDPRVTLVVESLRPIPWTELSLHTLGRHLLAALHDARR